MKLFNPYALTLFFYFLTSIAFGQWQQSGQITDNHGTDWSNNSLSVNADGTRMIAQNLVINSSNPSYSIGHVVVYDYDGTNWNVFGNTFGDTDIHLGPAVDINNTGDIIAIGSPLASFNGIVQVFQYNDGIWEQLGNDIEGLGSTDRFGEQISLSSSGTTIAIGAPEQDGDDLNSGYVSVYSFDGSHWIQKGNTIDGEEADDHFGLAVSINDNGNKIVVGAPFSNVVGRVKAYEYQGGSWHQMGSNLNGSSMERYGIDVDMSANGNRIAIGASRNSDNFLSNGRIQIYEYNGTDWDQLGADITGENNFEAIGQSISLNAIGTIIVSGMPTRSATHINEGGVRVFQYNNNQWSQFGSDIVGENEQGLEGISVCLSSNGSVLASRCIGQQGQIRTFTSPNLTMNEIKKDYHIYPNPTSGEVYISERNNQTIKDIKIANSFGQVIFRMGNTEDKDELKLDIKHLPNGLYFMNMILDNGSVQSDKLILRK